MGLWSAETGLNMSLKWILFNSRGFDGKLFSTIILFQLMAAISRMRFSLLTFLVSPVNRLCFLGILKDLDFRKMAKDGK